MQILLTGLNHKTAPLEIREMISFPKEQLSNALSMLENYVEEGVILSTCNRTEVYTIADDPNDAASKIRQFLVEYHGLDGQLLFPHLYDHTDVEAVRHLFKVASSLDSMILGESQILGQVREALTMASKAHSLRLPMSRLFHRAIRTGRRVREETAVGRNALSVSYAAVYLTQHVLGDLDGLRVLLVGAGEVGKQVAEALRTKGVRDMMVSNRTVSRAEELSDNLGGRVVLFSEIESSLANADVVIAATEAPDFVFTKDAIVEALCARDRHGIFLFDLAVPRNIDPSVAAVDNVNLFNIDDLSRIADKNLEQRKGATVYAEEIVEAEIEGFIEWWESLGAIPLITALRQKAERIRRRELDQAIRKMPDLALQETEMMDSMTRSIINALLHDPTMSLKNGADKIHFQVVRDLFNLGDDI